MMTKALLLILIATASTATAQHKWTISEYEWHDKKTFDNYIKPDQWLHKTITFYNNSISFDFKGIDGPETDIDYANCQLLQSIDTTRITDKSETMFMHRPKKSSGCNENQLLIIDTKPNCYKFPFREFMICDRVGFFELRGVIFTMKKE